MRMAAERLERPVEERIARLESHVEHIQADIVEMKTDICELKTDVRRLGQKVDQKFDSLKDSQNELRLSMERSFTRMLMLYFALAASLLGVMAKGFGWIS